MRSDGSWCGHGGFYSTGLCLLVLLSLTRTATSNTACRIRHVPDWICTPNDRLLCTPKEDFLFFRSRLSRILFERDLPWLAPLFQDNVTEKLADVQAWKTSGVLGFLRSLRFVSPDLTAALALICEGLLEAERHALRIVAGIPTRTSAMMDVAVLLLQEVLAGPWSRVALSGWPVFALLARIARGLSLGFGHTKRRSCPGKSPWKSILQAANATGLSFPPDNYSLYDLADIRRFNPGFMNWDSSCLWEAADQISIPTAPVCVTVPAADEAVASKMTLARDCNANWPSCEPVTDGSPSLHYRLQLPQRREMAAETIREAQRPYCALNLQGWVVSEAEHLFAKLAAEHLAGSPKRPLQLVEVGSNFGDCAFAVNAIAQRADWPLQATCFEPGVEAAQVFRKSLRLNVGARSAITLREEAVIPGEENTVEFVVPDESGVHGSLVGAQVAVSTKRSGMTQQKRTVPASSLDRAFGGARVVDLLLVGTTTNEMDVIYGATQLLREMRAKSIITFTWNVTLLRQHFAAMGYTFVKHFDLTAENSLHLLRAGTS